MRFQYLWHEKWEKASDFVGTWFHKELPSICIRFLTAKSNEIQMAESFFSPIQRTKTNLYNWIASLEVRKNSDLLLVLDRCEWKNLSSHFRRITCVAPSWLMNRESWISKPRKLINKCDYTDTRTFISKLILEVEFACQQNVADNACVDFRDEIPLKLLEAQSTQ